MAYNKENEIRQLLELYFEGATTQEQEEALRDFLTGNEIPADLLYAKAIFGGFAAIRAEGCPGTVENIFPTTSEMVSVPAKPYKGKLGKLYASVSVAVSILTAACLAWIFVPAEESTVYCYVNGEPVTNLKIASRNARMAGRLLQSGAWVSEDGRAILSEAGQSIEQLDRVLRFLEMTPENEPGE